MAEQPCLPQVHACAVRVARLEEDGVPLPGASNLYVSEALTVLTLTPVYEDGDEITEKNACGSVCINYKGNDSLKRVDFSLTLCTPDPFLHEMLAGGDVLSSGDRRGYAFPAIGEIDQDGVSIELWAKRIDDGSLDATSPYAWWVLPRARNIRHGERTFQNGPQLSVFSGQVYENPNWFDGPDNLWDVDSDRVVQWMPTDTLPTASCGYQTLTAS